MIVNCYKSLNVDVRVREAHPNPWAAIFFVLISVVAFTVMRTVFNLDVKRPSTASNPY